MAGTLLAFVIALGEYVASVFSIDADQSACFNCHRVGAPRLKLGPAAAYGVVLIGIIATVMIVASRLEESNQGSNS